MDNFLSLSGSQLDRKIASVYSYWKLRGFWSSFFHLFNRLFYLHFTLAMLGFLIFFVDYGVLLSRVESKSADSITLRELVREDRPLTPELVLYALLFSLFSLVCFFSFLLPHALELRRVRALYLDLGISDALLLTLSFEAVLRKLHRASPRHTPLSLEQRLLRMDNFVTHMYTAHLIQRVYTDFFSLFLDAEGHSFLFAFMPRVLSLHTQPVHAVLVRALSAALFCDGQVRPELCGAPGRGSAVALAAAEAALQRRLRLFGVVSVLLAPVALPAALLWTLVKYAPQMQVEMNGGGIKSMDWNFVGKMEMRNFMELDHSVERRLHEAYGPVLTFLSNFQKPVLSKLAELILFPLGAVLALLTLLLLINRELTIFDLPVLWIFVTVIVPCAYFLTSLIPPKHYVFDPHTPYTQVVSHIPYLSYDDPDTMPQLNLSVSRELRAPPTTRTVSFFSQFLELKFFLIAKEGLALLFFPLTFLFILPSGAGEMVKFFHENVVTSPLDVGTIDRIVDVQVDDAAGTVELKKMSVELESGWRDEADGIRRVVLGRKVANSVEMFRLRYYGKERGYTTEEGGYESAGVDEGEEDMGIQ